MNSYTTYRLHVTVDTPSGCHLHVCRGVDTYAQAEELAQLGHELDARDGLTTSYELQVWETGRDRSVLQQRVSLP